MANEPVRPPRVRAFVALDIPEGLRAGLAGWAEAELADPALRPVPAQYLHATLIFLGWLGENEVSRTAAVLQELGGEAPYASLEPDPVARPTPRRARVFAAAAPSPGAVALQNELERRLVAEDLYEPEKRDFWSHITLARVRKERGSKRHLPVKEPPGRLPAELCEPFRFVRLTLYRSTLRQQGAQYTPLAQIELPEPRAAVR